MADPYKRERDRYRSPGYAASGHPAGERPDGNLPERYRAAGTLLRCGKRANQHPPAAGGRDRSGEDQGRPVWQAAAENAGAFREDRTPVGKEKINIQEALERSGMSESTFYRKARMYRTPKK